MKRLKFVTGIMCLVLATVLVFRSKNGSDSADVRGITPRGNDNGDSRRVSRAGRYWEATPLTHNSPPIPRALAMPVRPVDKNSLEDPVDKALVTSLTPSRLHTDDEILTRGRILPAVGKTSKTGYKEEDRRSIKSEDWKGAANLLVNALRAGNRFEVNHDQLMDFLRGKDLLGWPESYRNWIGDELMTALRQDMPETAFESLKSIEVDSTAPAAMRDYSVQHISHLVTSGVIGKEGAESIWRTLEKNDPQTLSTALISLQRLSQQKPDLVSAKDVQAAAGRLKASPDERTRITAESILKE